MNIEPLKKTIERYKYLKAAISLMEIETPDEFACEADIQDQLVYNKVLSGYYGQLDKYKKELKELEITYSELIAIIEA